MIERIAVGSGLVLLMDIELSALLAISVFFVLGLYVLFCRPYLKKMHNIRFICNMLICIAIQIIYLLYRKSSLQDQHTQPIWFLMPIVVCGLLIICLIYNVVILIYELCLRFVENKNKEKIDK